MSDGNCIKNYFQFIAGYFKGIQNNAASRKASLASTIALPNNTFTEEQFEQGIDEITQEIGNIGDDESEAGVEEEDEGSESKAEYSESKPINIIVHMHHKEISLNTFCSIKHEWEYSTKIISVSHDIDTFKETVMFPINNNIYVFYVDNSSITHVQSVDIETQFVQDIQVPGEVQQFSSALFCLLNDEIYCIGRNEQNSYQK